VAVNPNGGFDCYSEMPFSEHARITLENTHTDQVTVYLQVDYWLGSMPEAAAYLQCAVEPQQPADHRLCPHNAG
jgi:D-arabinan exo alpha-(1,3)/(1,5)-arabinofuranosidase (non-reducing end)